ncbi:MAG: hypothetical protein COB08_018450 [Rhodobacteraceae bacterium]|nr:hypothetical protein [Paracoccaceae bacterium]
MIEGKNIEIKNAVGRGNSNPPTLTIDWELYGKYLDESDLSDTEKREFLETLWSIVVSFVDLGFGVHPLQQVTDNACAHQAEIARFIAANAAPVVTSREPTTPNFNASADRQSGLSQERNPK